MMRRASEKTSLAAEPFAGDSAISGAEYERLGQNLQYFSKGLLV